MTIVNNEKKQKKKKKNSNNGIKIQAHISRRGAGKGKEREEIKEGKPMAQ